MQCIRAHIYETHVKSCSRKSRFINLRTAKTAIRRTLEAFDTADSGTEIDNLEKQRICLTFHFNFLTGFDRDGRNLFGCKVVLTAKDWLITAYPV